MILSKEDLIGLIYGCSAAKYFDVDKRSYLYEQVVEVAEKLEWIMKNINN